MKKLDFRCASAIGALAIITSAVQAQEQKPNILWIITDDHRADALECWNRATTGKSESELGYVSSPNLDRLASEGVLFTNSWCNSPASAPSRASMHTGKYPFRSGIYNFQLTHNTNDFANPLIPDMMREQGYRATSFGKTGYYIFTYKEKMGYNEYPFYNERVGMENDLQRVGITDWCKKAVYNKGEDPGQKEFWYYPDGSVTSYYISRKGKKLTDEDIATAADFYKKHDVVKAKKGSTIFGGVSPMPADKTLDGRITEEFCRYFDNESKNYKLLQGREVEGVDPTKPQFIHLGYHFPHTPVMPSKEYRDKFEDKRYSIPEFTKEEFDKMPPQLQKISTQNNLEQYTPKQHEQAIRDYYAFCAQGDQQIGNAVDRFKEYCAEKKQEYIVVIVCGDHGWHLGEQGLFAKFTNYLRSNQTAVIAISSDKKRFPAGKVVDQIVEYVDFAPTFFAAAGCDLRGEKFDYLDGRDLSQVAAGKVDRAYTLGEGNMIFGPRVYMRSDDFAFSMRSRKENGNPSAKLPPNVDIKWAMECPVEEAEMALFDLRVDPKEVNNVANDPKYAALAAWFRNKLGNIALGDRRLECDWDVKNSYNISTFALGSDDKKLDIPAKIIPKVKK